MWGGQNLCKQCSDSEGGVIFGARLSEQSISRFLFVVYIKTKLSLTLRKNYQVDVILARDHGPDSQMPTSSFTKDKKGKEKKKKE